MQYTAKLSVAFAVLASVAHSAPVAQPQDYAALDWSSINAEVDWASVFSKPAAAATTTAAAAPAVTTPASTPVAATTTAAAVTTAPAASTPTASTSVAHTSASSSAASPSSTSSSSGSSSSGSSGTKRGLAFSDSSLISQFSTSAISWAYNWGSSCTGLKSGFTYVPMLWGTASEHSASWSSDAAKAIQSGSTHLLGFNEPDMPAQANLSPSDAASAWTTYMEPFAGKAKLGSPAVSNSATAGEGLDWMKQFLSACSSCTIDFLVVHWYQQGVDGAADAFKQHITDSISTANGKPVWITEFGIFGATAEEQAPFVQEVLPWLDSQDGVEGYSYFGALPAPSDYLVDASGALTTAGQAYNS